MKKLLLLFICLLLCSCNNNSTTNNTVSNNIRVTEGVLKADNNTFEFGDLIKIRDIFNNDELDYKEVYLNMENLGNQNMTINYSWDGVYYQEVFNYNVVDTTKPLIYLSGSKTVTVNSNINLSEYVICADNHDIDVKCYITGNYDLNKVGDYSLVYHAEDSSGNKNEVSFILHVVNPSKSTSTPSTSKTYISDVIRKYKNDKTMIGIDVSKWQGEIDWTKVKEAGVEFAMIRLGVQKDFHAEYVLDQYYEDNIKGATENGIKVGLYMYTYSTNPKEAIDAANFVLDNIKGYKIDLPIAYDWEGFTTGSGQCNFQKRDISLYTLRASSYAFQDTIKEAGYTPVQYGGKNSLNTYWLPTKYQTWLAHYTNNLAPSSYDKDYIMWQLCSDGRVDGINGAVDIDVYYLDK